MIHAHLLTMEPHPARKRDKRTKQMTDEPLFPNQRQIMHAGRRIGYCTDQEGSKISLVARYSDEDHATIRTFVEQYFGTARGDVNQPPEPLPVDPEEIEFDEDDE